MRRIIVAGLLSLLLVPVFPVTISTLRAPAPWRLVDLDHPESIVLLSGVQLTLVLCWIVLPCAVGAWLRSWWWPVFCVGVVLLTAGAWNGGYATFPPDGYGSNADKVAATIWVVPDAFVLGGLAALAAGVGVLCSRNIDALPDVVRGRCAMVALATAVIPMVVIPIVLLSGPLRPEALHLELAASLIWLLAWVGGASAGGHWIRRWWWPLYCLVAPMAVIWMWGLAYDDFRRFDTQSFAGLLLLIMGVVFSLIAAVVATIGVRSATREGVGLSGRA